MFDVVVHLDCCSRPLVWWHARRSCYRRVCMLFRRLHEEQSKSAGIAMENAIQYNWGTAAPPSSSLQANYGHGPWSYVRQGMIENIDRHGCFPQRFYWAVCNALVLFCYLVIHVANADRDFWIEEQSTCPGFEASPFSVISVGWECCRMNPC